ncbi:hypothetical protein [Sulfurospirillum sp. 1612]|uniref:hypothetical protein n=1 Tax=Sulfurospirillum sp. 1612 TaxID=3094835 RepID=UPI002F931660
MDSIKVLEEIGLKEISKKTHIEIKFLEYIINSDFDKLNKTNSIGFVKIISREYQLDLSDWLDEARAYWDAQIPEPEEQKIFIAPKSKKIPKSVVSLLAFVILVAILYAAYMFLDKKLNFFENTVLKKDINYTYEETPAVSEAKKTLAQEIIVPETNTTAVIEENQSDVNQSVAPSVNATETETIAINQNETKKTNEVPITPVDKKSFIEPNKKLWIGIIDLNTYKRTSYVGDGNYSIDPKNDQLITTGHGDFTMHFKGVSTEYTRMEPLDFLIKDGKLTEISKEEFKKLNRGTLW